MYEHIILNSEIYILICYTYIHRENGSFCKDILSHVLEYLMQYTHISCDLEQHIACLTISQKSRLYQSTQKAYSTIYIYILHIYICKHIRSGQCISRIIYSMCLVRQTIGARIPTVRQGDIFPDIPWLIILNLKLRFPTHSNNEDIGLNPQRRAERS